MRLYGHDGLCACGCGRRSPLRRIPAQSELTDPLRPDSPIALRQIHKLSPASVWFFCADCAPFGSEQSELLGHRRSSADARQRRTWANASMVPAPPRAPGGRARPARSPPGHVAAQPYQHFPYRWYEEYPRCQLCYASAGCSKCRSCVGRQREASCAACFHRHPWAVSTVRAQSGLGAGRLSCISTCAASGCPVGDGPPPPHPHLPAVFVWSGGRVNFFTDAKCTVRHHAGGGGGGVKLGGNCSGAPLSQAGFPLSPLPASKVALGCASG
jgi:hypothetical protein